MDMQYKVSFKKGMGVKGADLICFEGALNVQNIQAIKECMISQVKDSSALQVKVENAEQLDVTFLQLLLGLKIKFKLERMPIFFDIDVNKETDSILTASGFGELLYAKY